MSITTRPVLLRRRDVVRMLGVSRQTLTRIEQAGHGPPRRRLSPVGRVYLYDLAEVREWLESRVA